MSENKQTFIFKQGKFLLSLLLLHIPSRSKTIATASVNDINISNYVFTGAPGKYTLVTCTLHT